MLEVLRKIDIVIEAVVEFEVVVLLGGLDAL
jgi:hypothetical protein